jgi:hypothetical protein
MVCTLIGTLAAQDQYHYRNAAGWNSGLSFRRYLGGAWWIGGIVSGDATNTIQQDTTRYTNHYYSPDSTANSSTINKTKTNFYSGMVSLGCGREFFRYKIISLDAVISEGYSYSNSRTITEGSNDRTRSYPRNALITSVGIEPKAWIFNRFSLGTDFGIRYTFTFGTDNTSTSFGTTIDEYYRKLQGTYLSNEFATFGAISLSMALNAYFYF